MSVFTYKNVYRAYLDCRRNKRKTVNALKFEMNVEENISILTAELKNGSYHPECSVCFIVTEPSPREIFAADFRDRIVHHLFVGELIGVAERVFVFDTFACRKGKGTHKAVERLRLYAKKVTQDFRTSAWYMKLDISGFFMSINQDILYRSVFNVIDRHSKSDAWKREMAELARVIIFHKPTENYRRKGDVKLIELIPPHKSLFFQKAHVGLPIGNYSSQFFGNIYLNTLDHFIKRDLKCLYYVRYVDDLVFFSRNKDDLNRYRQLVKKYLRQFLELSLNENKTVMQTVKQGIYFLGYFSKSEKTYARKEVHNRCKNKFFKAATGSTSVSWRKLRSIEASYRGHRDYFFVKRRLHDHA